MKTLIAAAVITIGLAGTAGAHEPYGEKPLDANTAQTFQSSAAGVRSEMRPGGRYAFVNPAERARIDAALTDIDKVYAEHGGSTVRTQRSASTTIRSSSTRFSSVATNARSARTRSLRARSSA